jgi:hypothetical protein
MIGWSEGFGSILMKYKKDSANVVKEHRNTNSSSEAVHDHLDNASRGGEGVLSSRRRRRRSAVGGGHHGVMEFFVTLVSRACFAFVDGQTNGIKIFPFVCPSSIPQSHRVHARSPRLGVRDGQTNRINFKGKSLPTQSLDRMVF